MLAVLAGLSWVSPAMATVTGLDVVYEGVSNGRYVYSVYVVSNDPSNVLVSVYRHTVLTGSMSGVQHDDVAGGSWRPAFTPTAAAGYDSFVTVTGVSGASSATELDPGFGAGTGSTIPSNSGWYSSTPTSLPAFGVTGRIKIMQVSGEELTTYEGRLKVSYKSSASSSTPIFSPEMTYSIGGPVDSDGDGSDDLDDCDPDDPDVYPNAPETCGNLGTNNDCDSANDEAEVIAAGAADLTAYYRDFDGDGFGVNSASLFCADPGAGWQEGPGNDCDDGNLAINPLAQEVCDANNTDEDCDGYADDLDTVGGATGKTRYYRDFDNDGFGVNNAGTLYCDPPSGWLTSNTDCNDTNADINPAITEICDTYDNDCDGFVDDADPSVAGQTRYYPDADGDGYGDRTSVGGLYCLPPTDSVTDNTDCNDSPGAFGASINPGAAEVCDPLNTDEDCDGYADDADTDAIGKSRFYEDWDSDGYGSEFDPGADYCDPPIDSRTNNLDCDDYNSAIKPGAPETCANLGTNNDCDSYNDEAEVVAAGAADLIDFYADTDGDGYGSGAATQACAAPANHVTASGDCYPNLNTAYPGAPEICDGYDNDCDGYTDDADASVTDQTRYYPDTDGDGYGDRSSSGALYCFPASGRVTDNTDCNDSAIAINPGAQEVCDSGVDNDCDGYADDADSSVTGQSNYYADTDGDGASVNTATLFCANPGAGWLGSPGNDCDDGNAAINPSAQEVCDANNTDEDCDGYADDLDTVGGATGKTRYYRDFDNDGFGVNDAGTLYCDPPSGWLTSNTDCNDTNADINPAITEICDTYDNDCDGYTDDADPSVTGRTRYYPDADGDSYGNRSDAGTLYCFAGAGRVTDNSDCDDTAGTGAAINPAAQEVCDSGVDNDCDGYADDADPSTANAGKSDFYADGDGDGYGAGSAVRFCVIPASGYSVNDDDCADAYILINPGAQEICDGIDNDCDNLTDDADPGVTGRPTWYEDSDNDGFGDPDVSLARCAQPSGYVSNSSDGCPTVQALQAPITYYINADSDGYGGSETADLCATSAPTGYSSITGDCGDAHADIYPGAAETCANLGTNNDCDGDNDEAEVIAAGAADLSDFYVDGDGDGYGDPAVSTLACEAPEEYVGNADDQCPDVHELHVPATYYFDADGDGYGDPSITTDVCDTYAPDDYVGNDDDGCPSDPCKFEPGANGCGIPERFDGQLRAWGTNEFGQIDVSCDLGTIQDAAGGFLHTVALDTSGTVHVWGAGDSDPPSNVAPDFGQSILPEDLGTVIRVGAGYYHSIAQMPNGTLRLWGNNADGQCNVPSNLFVTDFAAGGFHTVVLLPDGTVRCYGAGQVSPPPNVQPSYGQSAVPAVVANADAEGFVPVIQVTAGLYFTSVLRDDGSVIAWGDNAFGQCSPPVDLGPAAKISAGRSHCVALMTDGSVRAWGGFSSDGEVLADAPLDFAVDIAAGFRCNVALNAAGEVFVWGSPAESEQAKLTAPSNLGTADRVWGIGRHLLARMGPPLIDSDNDGDPSTTDCNDSDPAVNRQAAEICDGIDNNCVEGIDEGYTDTDDDGTADCVDPDDDGDGYNDDVDLCPQNSALQSPISFYLDSDGDGYGDPGQYTDLLCTAPTGYVANSSDLCPLNIALQSPIGYFVDGDSDGYGAGSAVNFCQTSVPSGYSSFSTDCDETTSTRSPGNAEACDGIDNNCVGGVDEGFADMDTDGSADCVDEDDDGDGVPDADDAFPLDSAESVDTDGDGIGDNADEDDDGDGVPDTSDTCRTIPNADQYDCDGDGYGNQCDDDDDNDLVLDAYDNCPESANAAQADADGDGRGDECESAGDENGDGIPDWQQAEVTTVLGPCGTPGVTIATGGSDALAALNEPSEQNGNGALQAVVVLENVVGQQATAEQESAVAQALPDGLSLAQVSPLVSFTLRVEVIQSSQVDPEVRAAFEAAVSSAAESAIQRVDLALPLEGDFNAYFKIDPGTGVVQLFGWDPATGTGAVFSDTNGNGLVDMVSLYLQDGGRGDFDGLVDGRITDPGLAAEITGTDADGDGFPDATDNCPSVANTNQADFDLDGLGNACDEDDDGDGTADGGDCDLLDAAVYPGAPELCATVGVDNDCDESTDDTDADASDRVQFYSDADGDGYTLATGAPFCAGTSNAGYRAARSPQLDCDDTSVEVYPGAPELCATVGVDNDCDGDAQDSTGGTVFFADSDGDGYGSAAVTQVACSMPSGYIIDSTDCNDGNSAAYPGAPELCATIGTDNDCDGDASDSDADAPDTSTFYRDADGDGVGDSNETVQSCQAPAGYVTAGGDGCPFNPFSLAPIPWHRDMDGDSFGNPNNLVLACSQPPGYIPENTDCDDTRASVNPSAQERCDAANLDEDCDGLADDADPSATGQSAWYVDADGDGYGAGPATQSCDAPSGAHVGIGADCDDSSAATFPGAPETCGTVGIDNDCDGDSQEGVGQTTYYRDQDGDGYGDSGVTLQGCSAPSGYTLTADDCDDTSADAFPGAAELCATAGTDNDCDGEADDVDANAVDKVPFFRDQDGDTYTLLTSAMFCPGTSNPGWLPSISLGIDCNDTSASVYPGAPELCATVGIDNDCDFNTADVDADAADRVAFYRDQDGDSFTLATTALFCPGTTNTGWNPQASSTLDCDDTSAASYPGAPELCATVGTDNNCNGNADDVDADASDLVQYYSDSDGDGFTLATGALFCPGTTNAGYLSQQSAQVDCDDTSAATYPGAPELCDTIDTDNDCDGDAFDATDTLTWYADADGDDVGDASVTVEACSAPAGFVGSAGDGCPSNGALTEPVTYFVDADRDGYGGPDVESLCEATAPEGYSEAGGDCDDDAPGVVTAVRYFRDTDGDGYGDPADFVDACASTPPSGYVSNSGDLCVEDPSKSEPGECGCGVPDEDSDGDGLPDCGSETPSLRLVARSGGRFYMAPIVIDVTVGPQVTPSAGAQLTLRYDTAKLDFVSMSPGGGPVFNLQIAEAVDPMAGTIMYAVAASEPGQSSAEPGTVATIEFRLADGIEEVCDASALVTFEPVNGSSSALGTLDGSVIIPTTIDLGPISASTEPLGLLGVPDGWQRPADAGRLGSVFADPQVTGSLPCSGTPPAVSISVQYPPGHSPASGSAWPSDGLFPVGTTRVTWSVEAVPGDPATAFTSSREFTVLNYALMDLELSMTGVMSAAHQRSIEVSLASGGWMPAGTVLVVPSGSGTTAEGRGMMQVQVPVTTVGTDCIAVRDPVHTIADAGGPTLAGLRWSLSVVLKQGDSNGDNRIDILDYMFFLLDSTGTPVGPSARSNFNGDAFINSVDFSFIGFSFFSIGETCGGGTASDGARDRMSVAELRKLGLGELAVADLNRDGWVDLADMALWMQGVRPASEAGDHSASGNVAE